MRSSDLPRLLGFGFAAERIDPAFGGDPVGRDLRLTDGPDGPDLALVSESDNLAQALAIALTTRLGDDLFNGDHGFDGLNALAEEVNPVIARERVRVAVIQVLRRDPRVRRIVDLQLGAPASGDRRTLDVRVVFEVISGAELAVELSAGGA